MYGLLCFGFGWDLVCLAFLTSGLLLINWIPPPIFTLIHIENRHVLFFFHLKAHREIGAFIKAFLYLLYTP